MTVSDTVQDALAATAPDLTACDREPIHIPGSIQRHGMLLIADGATLTIRAGAGDIEARLADTWDGRPLQEVIGQDAVAVLGSLEMEDGTAVSLGRLSGRAEMLDMSAHLSGGDVVVELEPAAPMPASAVAVLSEIETAGASFERATDLRNLCERAVTVFRRLTGFDRVMVYRFLDDEAGVVLAEDRDPALPAFLNHHFPATDIPKQARALYIRNRIRVIPNVAYEPRPLRPASAGLQGFDLSDVALRSVSPIHLQYLKNMGVAASASISIVKDGLLWGLIACHHGSPRALSYDVRAACRAIAGGLARQIRAKEESELYRERLHLRGAEDTVVGRLSGDESLIATFEQAHEDMRRMLGATGFAMVQRRDVKISGACPSAIEVKALADRVRQRALAEPFATNELSATVPAARDYADVASGLIAVTLSTEDPAVLMWFRPEQIEVVNWAGNPHKAVQLDPNAMLTPRTSFEAWSQTVRSRARPWTFGEIEAVHRLRRALFDSRQTRRLREVNRELNATIADKESLLQQKDFLIKEVNHRVQNSLQLVSAFLGLQAREIGDSAAAVHFGEAQSRLAAVALVHRRLYWNDQVETVDLARYLEDLCADMKSSMGADWSRQLSFDLAPVSISTDRAVNVGLILTELVINASKYAYGGAAGPIAISLEQHRNQFRMIVADGGRGGHQAGKGFGTRMMNAMVDRLSGTIEYLNNDPGLRVIVSAPAMESTPRVPEMDGASD